MENFKTNINNGLKIDIELAMRKTDHLTETLENNSSIEEEEGKTPTEQIAPKDTSATDELEQATIVTKEKIIEIKRELGIHTPNEEAVLSLDKLKTAYNIINNDIKMHDTFNALIQIVHPNHVVHEEYSSEARSAFEREILNNLSTFSQFEALTARLFQKQKDKIAMLKDPKTPEYQKEILRRSEVFADSKQEGLQKLSKLFYGKEIDLSGYETEITNSEQEINSKQITDTFELQKKEPAVNIAIKALIESGSGGYGFEDKFITAFGKFVKENINSFSNFENHIRDVLDKQRKLILSHQNNEKRYEELALILKDEENREGFPWEEYDSVRFKHIMGTPKGVLNQGDLESGLRSLSLSLFNKEVDLEKLKDGNSQANPRVLPNTESLPITPNEDAKIDNVDKIELKTEKYRGSETRVEELDMPEVSFDKKIEIPDIIKNEFSYQDAELPEETKKRALDWSSEQENSKKYAEALSVMLRKRDIKDIEKISLDMVEKCGKILNKLGVKAGPYSKSKTWAMWDIAKQFYFLTHQEEADKRYEIAHPIDSPKKQKEIIDRHVGWEVYGAFQKMNEAEKQIFLTKFEGRQIQQQIKLLLNKAPKMDNPFSKTLSSLDLAILGSLVHKD